MKADRAGVGCGGRMKAFLIDPKARTVTEVEHDDDFRDIQRQIEVDCFTTVRCRSGDMIYVDDMGMFRPELFAFSIVEEYPGLLLGRAMILGVDDIGNSTDPTMTLEHVQACVEWQPVGEGL